MNPLKKVYCRSFQTVLKAVKPFLPYKDPILLDNAKELIELLKGMNIKNVLIVTDKNLLDLKAFEKLKKELISQGIQFVIFSDTVENPSVENAYEAANIFKQSDCQAIIAFGGGSVMDCAKAAGAIVARPNKDLKKMKGLLKVHKKLPLLIAIPTTSGTGSEITISSVITDKENKDKFVINDFNLLPHIVVLDAANTEDLSPEVLATTGMDALTHAVEAYIGNNLDEESKKDALEAIRLIVNNLEEAYREPTIKNKEQLLFASYLAGRAFSKSYVGYVHALAHALGGTYNIKHGLANAILLPHVLEAYRPQVDEKLKELAVHIHLCEENEFPVIAASTFIHKISTMNRNLDIPTTFNELERKDIPKLAKHAEKEANPLYPVPVLMDKKDLSLILYQCLDPAKKV